jgi:hypothetical protein
MLTHPARRSRATVRGALGGFLTALLLALLLVSLPSASQAQVKPAAVLLSGANTPRAKALALDAALLKGWSVAQSGGDHVVFEHRAHAPGAEPEARRGAEPAAGGAAGPAASPSAVTGLGVVIVGVPARAPHQYDSGEAEAGQQQQRDGD